MRNAIFLLTIFLTTMNLLAQVEDTTKSPRKDTLRQAKTERLNATTPKAYVALRPGLWLTGDAGLQSTTTTTVGDETIDNKHGGGFGVDVHYSGSMGYDLYWDMALACWYSSNDSTITRRRINIQGDSGVVTRSAYSVIFPFTLGISYYFPSPIFLKPYAGVGFGVFASYTSKIRDESSFGAIPFTSHTSDEKYQATFGGFVNVGSKLAMSPTFGLDLSVKYVFGSFSEPLYSGVKNFSGLQVSLGLALIVPYVR